MESWRQAELQEDRKEQASLRDMTLIKSDTGGSEDLRVAKGVADVQRLSAS